MSNADTLPKHQITRNYYDFCLIQPKKIIIRLSHAHVQKGAIFDVKPNMLYPFITFWLECVATTPFNV
jgi:hypothetical protein